MAKSKEGFSVYQPKGRLRYHLKYYKDGVPIREALGTTDEKEAYKLARQRVTDVIDRSLPAAASMGKLRWEHAAADVLTDYGINDYDSLDDTDRRLRLHLTPYFQGRRMTTITTDVIKNYILKRRKDSFIPGTRVSKDGTVIKGTGKPRKYSNGQINRELAILKRMFKCAIENGKLAFCPYVPMLDESKNVRKGFFEKEAFDAIVAHLEKPLCDIATFAYLTAWRVDSEVLPLEWRHVHFNENEVRLDPEMCKNDDGRVIVMTDDLRALLLELWDEHQQRRKAGQMVPWVFVRMLAKGRGGAKAPKQVKSWLKGWHVAARAAGYPGKIPHDFRRSAARNMTRCGVTEAVAMKMGGWKTNSVFKRYNVVSENDLKEAAVKMSGQLNRKRAGAAEGNGT